VPALNHQAASMHQRLVLADAEQADIATNDGQSTQQV